MTVRAASAPTQGPTVRPSLRATYAACVASPLAAAVVALACWFLLSFTNLPSYNASFVTKALSTATTVLLLGFVAVLAWLHGWLQEPGPAAERRSPRPLPRSFGRVLSRRRCRHLAAAALYVAPAGLVITTIAIPLAATRLYLDGISVDQAFRTQYLTRMADHPGWEDMAYLGKPSFYPGLWFFGGGIFARILGLAAWAAYKPWALVTLAAAAGLLVPVWRRITGNLAVSAAIAVATVAVVLTIAPEEPYAAIVAMGMPAAMVLARRAFSAPRVDANLPAACGITLFLGLSAHLYTLFTAVSALTVVCLALAAAIRRRTIRPVVRLAAIGAASLAIAALGWGPYLAALLTQPHGPTGQAQHYLPEQGTTVPMPFFQASALGVLSLLALVWLLARRDRCDARALLAGLATCYGWVLASMAMTALGTTLLGFRLELPISVLLATAGVLAVADVRRSGIQRWYPQATSPAHARAITRVLAVVSVLVAVSFATAIPQHMRDNIDLAYTDTDGSGHRGDRFPADSTVHYAEVDRVLHDTLGKRSGAVVLTDEKNFLAFYPYHGYQALTAHYANPLGQFEARNAAIESWAEFTRPQQLLDALDKAQAEHGWTRPDAIVVRGELTDGKPAPGTYFDYQLADDIYPNQPNVRFRTLRLPAELLSSGWSLTQVGPFVVAIRKG